MGVISKTYLILYNLILTVGWGYLLYLTILNRENYKTMWPVIRFPLQIFQTAAVLEVNGDILNQSISLEKNINQSHNFNFRSSTLQQE